MSGGVQGVGAPAAALPPPEDLPARDEGLGIATRVMSVRSACRQYQVAGQTAAVTTAAAERQHHIDERLDAMRRVEEAQSDGGFWGKLADVLETVGLVAALVVGAAGSVFTAGASGVAAGVLFAVVTGVTTAAPYVGEMIATGLSLSPEARIALGACIAAACLACAFINPGAAATSTANVATASARAGSAVTQVAVIAGRVGQSVDVVTQFAKGYATVLGGVARIEEGDAKADALRCEARTLDATERRDDAVGRLEQISREALRAAHLVMSTLVLEEQSIQAALRA